MLRVVLFLSFNLPLILGKNLPDSRNGTLVDLPSASGPQDGISARVAAPPPPGANPNRGQVVFPSGSNGAAVFPSGSNVAAEIQSTANRLPFPQPVTINVGDNSQLFVPPGSTGVINVVLRNDGPGSNFLLSGADDKGYFQGFQTSQLGFLATGQSVVVSGRIAVPPFSPRDTVSTLTVYVQRFTDSNVSRRRIYITAKNEPGDNYNPRCYFTSFSKCDDYLESSLCAQRLWNFQAEIQDSDSGLRYVGIKPDGRFVNEDFPIGTNQTVTIDYSTSCCSSAVDIIAIDVRGRQETCRIDLRYPPVRLGGGEIAAIVLAIILLILLIVLAIVLICRCMRRRKSVKTAPPAVKSKGKKKDRQ